MSLIPSTVLTDWTPGTKVGVIGGIPTTRTQFVDATQSPYNADNTGTNSATTAIQNALNACPADQYVYLPAGTYKVGQINMPNSVTLKGAGMDSTILRSQSGTKTIFVGSEANYEWLGEVQVTAGNTRDSTTLTMASTSTFTAGKIALLRWTDATTDATLSDGSTFIVSSTAGPTYSGKVRRQMVYIVSKTSTQLTIAPGILHTPQTGTTLYAAPSTAIGLNVGVEDLTIDGQDSPPVYGIEIEQSYNCWIKNVKSTNISNYPFFLYDSVNCEITHSFASGGTGGGTNGAGILMNTACSCYVYDNIIDRVFPCFEINVGSCGNAVAYNLGEGSATVQGTLNCNHGTHNSHNLFEGNIIPSFQSDGYFGSASECPVFRNWIHGTNLTQDFNNYLVSLNRWTRYFSLVGNLFGHTDYVGGINYSFGNPNLGNASFTGTYQMSANDFPIEWKNPATLTAGGGTSSGTMTLASGNISTGQFRPAIHWSGGGWAILSNVVKSGTTVTFDIEFSSGSLPSNGTALEFWGGQEGFQGKDEDCYATYDGGTTNLRVNYWLQTAVAGIPANEVLGGDTFPDSLYLNSKPSWFRSLSWPPFNPQSPGSLTINQRYQTTPSGYRFVNGQDPPADTSIPKAKAFNVKKIVRIRKIVFGLLLLGFLFLIK